MQGRDGKEAPDFRESPSDGGNGKERVAACDGFGQVIDGGGLNRENLGTTKVSQGASLGWLSDA